MRVEQRPSSMRITRSQSARLSARWATMMTVGRGSSARRRSRICAFARDVDGAGGLVHDQQPRLAQDGARQREPLALAAGDQRAALADDGFQPLIHAAHETRRHRRGRAPATCRLRSPAHWPRRGYGARYRETGRDPAKYRRRGRAMTSRPRPAAARRRPLCGPAAAAAARPGDRRRSSCRRPTAR